jgi:magnesium chelatase subunit H
MKMLRRLPKILRFMPGKAQDLRAYFLTMQYWLGGSDDNVAAMIRFLVGRYAPDPAWRKARGAGADRLSRCGALSPRSAGPQDRHRGQGPAGPKKPVATVGLLMLRSYVLASDCAHYDGTIRALEARGLRNPGLCRRARRAPGDRCVLPRQGGAEDRRTGLAHRVQPGRRAGL